MVFGMPEVVLAIGREGTRVGHFRKEARRQLIAACVTLSEFVYGLEPLVMNQGHPTPPARLEVAIKSMVADGAVPFPTADRGPSLNVSHALQLAGAAPLQAPGGLKEGHRAPVTCVQTAGGVAVSSGDDGVLAVWDLASGTCVRTLPGHGDAVAALALFEAPAGQLRALSASRDGTLKLWALGTGSDDQPAAIGSRADADTSLRTYATEHGVACVAVLAGGLRAVSGGADGALRTWSLAGGADGALGVFEAHTGGAAMAVSGGADGALKVWSLAAAALPACAAEPPCAKPDAELRGHASAVNCVHVFASARAGGATCALSGDAAGGLKLWQLTSGRRGATDFSPRCLRALEGCFGGVWACSALASGAHALTVSDDTCLRLWDLDTGECAHALPSHPHREYCLAIGQADGSRAYAVTGGDDAGQLKVWHLPCPPPAACALRPASIPSLLEALSPIPKARRAPKAQAADDAGSEWEESELALNLGACFEE